jgi:hypothetical protein
MMNKGVHFVTVPAEECVHKTNLQAHISPAPATAVPFSVHRWLEGGEGGTINRTNAKENRKPLNETTNDNMPEIRYCFSYVLVAFTVGCGIVNVLGRCFT